MAIQTKVPMGPGGNRRASKRISTRMRTGSRAMAAGPLSLFPRWRSKCYRQRRQGCWAQLFLPACRSGRCLRARPLLGSEQIGASCFSGGVGPAVRPALPLGQALDYAPEGSEPANRRSLFSSRLGMFALPAVMRRPSVLPRGLPLGPCMASGLSRAPLPVLSERPQRTSLAQVRCALPCRTGVEGFSGPPSP